MGVVYEATQLSLDRTVALKVLAPHLGDDAASASASGARARSRPRSTTRTSSRCYEAGEIDDGLYLAMRLVRGAEPKELIVAGELTPARALRAARRRSPTRSTPRTRRA